MDFELPIKRILNEPDTYSKDISLLKTVICYKSFFQDIQEKDYLLCCKEGKFQYTPIFYSFVQQLFKADLVASDSEMQDFLAQLNCYNDQNSSCYKVWVKYMNNILADKDLIKETNLCFLKKSLATIISLEKIIPGSWGIDAENGNWLRIIIQIERIYRKLIA